MAVVVNKIASTVGKAMGDILSRRPLDNDEDFFLSGGDSLRAVELISRLAERYSDGDADRSADLGSALLIAVFDDATPLALSAVVRNHLG